MARIRMMKQKKGIVFTLIIILFMFSFLSLFSLLQTQQTTMSQSMLRDVEIERMNTVLTDISSSYKDVLGISGVYYIGNTTEYTFSLVGDIQVRSHTALFDSFLDEYEAGRIVEKGGLNVSHEVVSNDFIFYPFNSYLTLNTDQFVYGGGNVTDVGQIEINMTVDEDYASLSDTFANDGSGTVITLRVTDNTSTTYTITHTLSPTQTNENAIYTFTSGNELNITYGTGLYGSGTLNIQDNITSDVNVTGFSWTYDTALTSGAGFYTNTSVTFNAITLSFSGNTPLARG